MKSKVVIMAVLTIVQGLALGFFSIAMLLIVVARVMFLGKLLGMRTKASATVVAEAMGIFFAFLMPMLMRHPMNWMGFVVFFLVSFLSAGIVLYDEAVYLYIEEDL